jgi:hypothetical protein
MWGGRPVLAGIVAVCGLLGAMPGAHASLLGFETVPSGLQFDGDTFTEGAYRWTVGGSFGDVDTAAAFSVATLALAPTGNATQFYAGLDDSRVTLTRVDGQAFRLTGFDAGFVTPTPQASGILPGQIVVLGSDVSGTPILQNWEFAPSGAGGSFAFKTYSGADDFSNFASVTSLTFTSCAFSTSSSLCRNPAENLAQFAIDNVNVSAVPEPAMWALMGIGIAALATRRRTTA